MIQNEADATETSGSLTASSFSDRPPVAASRHPVVDLRHRQRTLHRSVTVRTRRRLLERRFTRSDRLASQEARYSRNAPTLLDQLRAALAEPIKRMIENITAPLQEMARRIAEMIRPSWLVALQNMQKLFENLVRSPMFDALRRIRERMSDAINPLRGVLGQIGGAIAASANLLNRAFEGTRDWASGFMSYGAKLRQLTDAMFSSWSWRLPDLTAMFKPIDVAAVFMPIVDAISKMVRSFDWSSRMTTVVQAVTRAVFWAAVKVRDAVVNDEDSEEVVRNFMLEILDLFPSGWAHIEAAKEALLEDAWLREDPRELKRVLRKRIGELHRNHRLIGATELRYRHVVSLDSPAGRSVSDGGRLLTIGESLADPLSVEDLVLGSPEFQDERIPRVLGKLKVQEAQVATRWARGNGMTWEKAAVEAGLPPGFGEGVRKKLRRLGGEVARRQANTLRTPVLKGSRAKVAFC